MRLLARLGLALLGLVLAFGALGFWALRSVSVPEPVLGGSLVKGSLDHGSRARTWLLYVPPRPTPSPALVLVYHGSGGDGARARAAMGYAFDRLADAEGFLVAYPDGYKRHWNDCRRAGPYEANRLDVDDVGFTRALVERLVRRRRVDRRRVFATGISNGGQMALRLALEAPDLVRAVAPVAASLPAGNNMDCQTLGRPVSVLVMNGTQDPMNPWAGGPVALYGLLGYRGDVLSTEDTVDYWRELAGLEREPQREVLPDRDPDDGSRAVRTLWRQRGHRSVELLAVVGGGHTVPHPTLQMPRILGRTNHDLVAAEEIQSFFREAP